MSDKSDKSLEERVSALEARVGNETIEEQFRKQAELIDEFFGYRFDESDKNWDAKLDAKFESKLAPMRTDLTAIRDAVKIILTRLP